MAIVSVLSNHMKYMMGKALIDLSDTTAGRFKAILMNTAFAFDPDVHATLNDVTTPTNYQIVEAGGYLRNNKALEGVAFIEDDTMNKAIFSCNDLAWTSSVTAIGPFGSLIIYDDFTSDDTIIGCVDFGIDYTINPGSTFAAQQVKLTVG